MDYIKRFIMIFFLCISVAFADTLELKVDQGPVNVPFFLPKKDLYGAVIIVRGGDQSHWSEMLANIAKILADSGWSVLLLNCNEGTSVPWINALPEAISVLRQKKNKRIVMIHYGDQVGLTIDYFNKPQAKMINGLILVSAFDSKQENLEKITGLRVPVFDVVGQFDYDTVLNQRRDREMQFRETNYQAVNMPGAHHDYAYSHRFLAAFVHGWMVKLPVLNIQPTPPASVSFIPNYHGDIEESQIASINKSEWSGFSDDPKEIQF